MTNYHKLSKAQLIDKLEHLRANKSEQSTVEHSQLRHDLEVHQIELEMQNLELREKQLELEKARDKYADLYDFAPVGYLTLDEKGVIRETNLTATRLLQQTRSQLLNKPFTALLANNNSRHFFRVLRGVIETKEEQSDEIKITCKDQAEICLLMQLAPSYEENSSEVRMVLLDISDMKLAEDRLRASERELRGILDTLQDTYYRTDLEGRIIQVSPSVQQLTGYTADELIGMPIIQFWRYPEHRQEMLKDMQQGSGATLNYAVEGVHKDSHTVWGEINAHFFHDQQGNVAGVEGTIRDITERKLAEDALRQERDKAQRYLDTVEAIIVALDIQGNVTLINRKGNELLGYREDELLGRDWFQMCLPKKEEKEAAKKIFKQAMAGNIAKTEYHENSILKHNGEERLIAWHNKYLRDKDGTITGVLSAGEDITERRHAEDKTQQLLQQNRDLAQRMFQLQEEERQYIARELHDEFGQWLTAIQLDAQNITNLIGHESPQVDASIESITHSAKQIHEGIRDMIHTLQPALLDELGLADSLRELVAQWQAHNPDIVCRLSIEGELSDLRKNLSITIYRLVQEGLTNVIKHAQANNVEVQLARKHVDSMNRDCLKLTIQDDGTGMPSDVKSNGIGLPGMRERVLAAGGRFSIKSPLDSAGHTGVCLRAKFFINPYRDKRL